GGNTDIDELTLACPRDNRLVDDSPTGWTTRKRAHDNRTEWIPPPHLDRGQPRTNNHHHPERILRPDEEHPDENEPDGAEPDENEPDENEPDSHEPDSHEPDSHEPDGDRTEQAEPG
ncbi:MAG: hypothetical protein QG655_3895, partial [Actinomycetota bacterium]|nr:hypothetical protein [Actinomycetota bacterium]